MDSDTYALIYEAYEGSDFESYFRFDGMQALNLEGTRKVPLFTLMQPLKGLDLHGTYTGKELKRRGVDVPQKYFDGTIEESDLPSVFDILSNAPIDTPTKELKDIEIEPLTIIDNEGNEIKVMALKNIVVRPEYRGQSIFSNVLDQLEKTYSNVLLYDVIHSKIKMAAKKRGYELIEGEDEDGTKTYHYLKHD